MQRKLRIIISTSAASVLALSALAQGTPRSDTNRPGFERNSTAHGQRADRLNGAAKASDIIGMTVKNNQDEKLGKVEDLAVDVQSGRVVQAIISTGGFLGIGDTLSAVPPGALHHDVGQKVLHLDVDKEKLKSAPRFDMANWTSSMDSNRLAEVYRYYGEEPAFTFIQRTEGAPDRQDRTTRTEAGRLEARVSNEGQFMIPASRLNQLQKASKVMGTAVKNLQNEKLGKVENLLLDMPSGRIVAVVVSSGGFLGMGDELSAVPPTALRFTADRDTLQLDATKEMLSSAPHFKANQWPDFAEPGYADSVYRAYKVDPYFSTNSATAADNTARNVRDRNDSTLTPFQQGGSAADRETTAQIRKEIMADKGMSVNAHNVKIITVDGRVTLRGPVKTAEEKTAIGAIASRIAKSGNVDNQLEVKLTPTGRN
jgi:sporulation protein YlmC with PRC-barrel domain